MKFVYFLWALIENNSFAAKNIPTLPEKLYFIYLYTYLKFKKVIRCDLLGQKAGSLYI